VAGRDKALKLKNINKMRFKRPCKRCKELFQPEGKYTQFCNNCRKPRGWKAHKKLHPKTKKHKNIIKKMKNGNKK